MPSRVRFTRVREGTEAVIGPWGKKGNTRQHSIWRVKHGGVLKGRAGFPLKPEERENEWMSELTR